MTNIIIVLACTAGGASTWGLLTFCDWLLGSGKWSETHRAALARRAAQDQRQNDSVVITIKNYRNGKSRLPRVKHETSLGV